MKDRRRGLKRMAVLLLCGAGLALPCFAQETEPDMSQDRVRTILEHMTLEEKIGQMIS